MLGHRTQARSISQVKVDKHTAYHNILDALPRAGCAICRLNHDVEVHYITDVLYSKTTSVQTRGELRQARGFCWSHALLLDRIGHALDLSIVYQDILMTVRDELQKPSPQQATSRRGKKRLQAQLSPIDPCPACIYRAELENVYVETYADHLADEAFCVGLRASDPLCLGHFRQVIAQDMPPARLSVIREIQVAHWQSLIEELGEFVRKHDHRFRHEDIGSERDAWIRAIDAITGTREY